MRTEEIKKEIEGESFVGDYKVKFEEYVDKLEQNRIENRSTRMYLVGLLCERYILLTGERPDSYQLNRLAGIILYEYMEGDSHPDKVTNTDFPILTESQTRRRHSGEVGDAPFLTMGHDGRGYSVPVRRKVSVQDQIKMDMDRYHKERAKGVE